MKDTNPIAHDLIDRFGSLQQVLDTSIVLLCDVKNMTQSAAIYLTALPKIFKKYNLSHPLPMPLVRIFLLLCHLSFVSSRYLFYVYCVTSPLDWAVYT